MIEGLQGLRARCEGVGSLEYVVESLHHGETETWLVVRPHDGTAEHPGEPGAPLARGSRLVVEAQSLRPVGVLEPELPEAPLPAGYNPYFDPPPV